METIRKKELMDKCYTGYLPFAEKNVALNVDLVEKWEIVMFISPHCDGRCRHCWSSDTFLGKFVPIEWYEDFWSRVDPEKVLEVRLTGGEPFLYKDIGKVVAIIRKYLGDSIPIRIFSSGRQFLSFEDNPDGVVKIVQNLLKKGIVRENVLLYLSADEHHAASLYQHESKYGQKIEKIVKHGYPLMKIGARNFLEACDILAASTIRFSGQLKIHVGNGRMKFHRERMFYWIDEQIWNRQVVSSEGLVRAGSAENLSHSETFELSGDGPLSMFVIPGARFYVDTISVKSQCYFNYVSKTAIYLDESFDQEGTVLIGWNNVVRKIFCGGTVSEAIDYLL